MRPGRNGLARSWRSNRLERQPASIAYYAIDLHWQYNLWGDGCRTSKSLRSDPHEFPRLQWRLMTHDIVAKSSFTRNLTPKAMLVGSLMLGGCSDAQSVGSKEVTTSANEAAKDPAFVVATRVWDDSSSRSYFHVLDKLDKGTDVDASKALEVPGSARLFSFEGLGWFGIGGAEEPTITKYDLNSKNELVAEESISMLDYGLSSLWPTMYVVSSKKVYHPDREGQQLIVWNPTTMEIEGAIPLPETNRAGYLANYGYSGVLRGTKLLFSVGWFDWSERDSILNETGLVVIDTKTDTVERFDVDPRCAGITETIDMPSGDSYFVSSALGAAAHKLERLDVAPCALRIRKDADTFDPDYALELSTLTGGALAGDPIPGPDDRMFLRVLDEQLVKLDEGALTYEITSQPAWNWVLWNPSNDELTQVDALPASPANVSWFEADERVFTIEEKSEPFESTLIELTAKGGPKTRLTAPGYLHALARVR